ncbi:MAG: pyrimidine-nucleoside phosphorylase [Lachnospiraceae bacterium]|nr:pyrimidine-nucleoside phosphorylase [Lachnospiraceae bacterium]
MRMYDLIQKKKNGGVLSKEEISYIVQGYTSGKIPDYQVSALLMAICFQGMNEEETLALTLAMRDSGDTLDLSQIPAIKVDKHSTGGVGDKTSLVLTPIVASLGVPVAKMSGRGLGHTGGTIDKLECFPGFTTALEEERFIHNVKTIGIAIAGQTANLAPADKKLYALRDVTATVAQPSLIASSIMSKKLASGSDAIVLDVKTGNGAFMQNFEDAKGLAEQMVRIGKGAHKTTYAAITDMSQPLGHAVGNTIEVIEAIQALQGNGPSDLMEVVETLGYLMLLAANKVTNQQDATQMIREVINSGAALKRFAEFVEAQGGDASAVYDTNLLPLAPYKLPVYQSKGYVQQIHALEIGNTCMQLGGGRLTKESSIDLSVGIYLCKKVGDAVNPDEPVAYVYANEEEKGRNAVSLVADAYTIAPEKPSEKSAVYACITE